MIEILQEITDWGEDKVSNHIYYVRNKTSLVAYIPEGSERKISLLSPCRLVSLGESLKNYETRTNHVK